MSESVSGAESGGAAALRTPAGVPSSDRAELDPNAVCSLGSSRGESERLRRQADELAPESEAALDQVGLRSGDSAIDLGCGPPGVIEILCDRVSPGGRVVGLDGDPSPRWVHGCVRNTVHFMRMAKIVPVREFRTKLSELLSDVADRRDHVLVTRNGKPAAALVPIDEYEALEETAEILSDSATLAAIEAGLAELARGESITLEDLRRDLSERRGAG